MRQEPSSKAIELVREIDIEARHGENTAEERRELLDYVASLEADRERLDWLESSNAIVAGEVDHTGDYTWRHFAFGMSLRDTIDAARSSQEEPKA